MPKCSRWLPTLTRSATPKAYSYRAYPDKSCPGPRPPLALLSPPLGPALSHAHHAQASLFGPTPAPPPSPMRPLQPRPPLAFLLSPFGSAHRPPLALHANLLRLRLQPRLSEDAAEPLEPPWAPRARLTANVSTPARQHAGVGKSARRERGLAGERRVRRAVWRPQLSAVLSWPKPPVAVRLPATKQRRPERERGLPWRIAACCFGAGAAAGPAACPRCSCLAGAWAPTSDPASGR